MSERINTAAILGLLTGMVWLFDDRIVLLGLGLGSVIGIAYLAASHRLRARIRRGSPLPLPDGHRERSMQTSVPLRRVPVSERINTAATLGLMVGLIWFFAVPVTGVAIYWGRDLWEMPTVIIARIALLGLCLGPVLGIALLAASCRRGERAGRTDGA